MSCCAWATRSTICAPSSPICSGRSALNAATSAPSNSPTSSNPTASRKTSRSVGCVCVPPNPPPPSQPRAQHSRAHLVVAAGLVGRARDPRELRLVLRGGGVVAVELAAQRQQHRVQLRELLAFV